MVYPNPVRGGEIIRVAVPVSGTVDALRVTIVTVSYRKVFEKTFAGPFRNGVATLVLDGLELKSANGLYYLVVRTPSGLKSTCKFTVLK